MIFLRVVLPLGRCDIFSGSTYPGRQIGAETGRGLLQGLPWAAVSDKACLGRKRREDSHLVMAVLEKLNFWSILVVETLQRKIVSVWGCPRTQCYNSVAWAGLPFSSLDCFKKIFKTSLKRSLKKSLKNSHST